MMPAEQRIEMLAKEIVSKTPCPKTAYRKEEMPERKRNRLIIFLLAVLCMSFVGAGMIVYYFSNANPAFETLQDNGYVSIVNKKQKKDGVTLTVEAAVTDGSKTYIRIRAKGLPKEQPVEEQISDAYLENEEGMRLAYQNVPLYTYKDTRITDAAPALEADNLEENEAVLLFYGAPAPAAEGAGSVSLHLSFEGAKGEFVENITLQVPKITTRDVSDLNLQITLPFGTGKIEQITYTTLETYFDVKWTIDGASAESLADYLKQYTGVYKNGENTVEYEPVHPFSQAVKDSVAVSQYTLYDQFTVPAAFDPEKPLVIEEKDKKNGQAEELVRIP